MVYLRPGVYKSVDRVEENVDLSRMEWICHRLHGASTPGDVKEL